MSLVTASTATRMQAFRPSLTSTCAKFAFFARINTLARVLYVDNQQQVGRTDLFTMYKGARGLTGAPL